jgi:hypothetical protein
MCYVYKFQENVEVDDATNTGYIRYYTTNDQNKEMDYPVRFQAVLEGVVLCETRSLIKAMGILASGFYLFNMEYPKCSKKPFSIIKAIFSHRTIGGHWPQSLILLRKSTTLVRNRK